MTGQPGPRADITVIGEAIIDLVPGAQPQTYHAAPGGSPHNVAIGLARLGHHTTLMARLADNSFGASRATAPRPRASIGRLPGTGIALNTGNPAIGHRGYQGDVAGVPDALKCRFADW